MYSPPLCHPFQFCYIGFGRTLWLGLPNAFAVSIVMTMVTFFMIGALKSIWSLTPWWRSAAETLLIGGAAAAIETASLTPSKPTITPQAAPKPAAAATAPKKSGLAKPFVQIGIFSVEQNAKNTATAMRQAGMVPTIKKHSSKGKTFWRVVVGPAQSKDELKTLVTKIKGTGFTDAYAVSN